MMTQGTNNPAAGPRPLAKAPARHSVSARKPLTPAQALRKKRPVDTLLDPELFKALCDATRVKLLGCLIKCGKPCNVSEIAACCDVDLSVVSRHLQLLERSGIVTADKVGRVVSYSVRYTHVCTALRNLAAAIEECQPGKACTSDACESCCDGTTCCAPITAALSQAKLSQAKRTPKVVRRA